MSRIGAREEGGWFLKGEWRCPGRVQSRFRCQAPPIEKPPQILHSKRQNNFQKLAG